MGEKYFIIAAIFLSFPSGARADDNGAIKFGVILALSGPASGPGIACKSGMEFAAEDLDEEVRKKLTLKFEDDNNSPQKTISAFKKLVELEKSDAVFSFSSGCSHAVAPLAEQSKTPLLAIASDQKVVDGKKYAMSIWVSPQEMGKKTFAEASRRGYKRIARVSAAQDGMLANREAFDKFNAGNIEIVVDDEYPLDTKDFKPFLMKLKGQKDLDAIGVYLYFGQSGVFAKQARQYGVTLPLFNNESFEDKGDVADSGGALVGQWFVNADDAAEDLTRRFHRKFPGATTVTLANCYDTVGLLGRAIKQGAASKDKLNIFLHTVKDYRGATGSLSATDENRFTLPAAVKIVENDGFKKLTQ